MMLKWVTGQLKLLTYLLSFKAFFIMMISQQRISNGKSVGVTSNPDFLNSVYFAFGSEQEINFSVVSVGSNPSIFILIS